MEDLKTKLIPSTNCWYLKQVLDEKPLVVRRERERGKYFEDHLDDEAEWEGEGDDDEEDGGEDEEVGAHLWLELHVEDDDG